MQTSEPHQKKVNHCRNAPPLTHESDYTPLFTTVPTDRQECWNRLEVFIKFWHGVSCPPVDYTRSVLQTEARLHVTLPASFVEWYMRFGRFCNLWCERGFNQPIDELHLHAGKLIIRTERVFNGLLEAKWGIPIEDLQSDDPQVVSILRDRVYPCADHFSQFAVYCTAFDSMNSHHTKSLLPNNDIPFPAGGVKMEFPDSFGVIKSEMYEGRNWLAMVSGTDWYLRRRNSTDEPDEFVKHELRSKELPP
jgi:hypothetical protein